MNSLYINISSVSNLLSIFYGIVGNTTDKTIQKIQENILSLQHTNKLIEELAERIWEEQDIKFANQEVKEITTIHQLITISYEGMKLIIDSQYEQKSEQINSSNPASEIEQYIEEYINEFEKLMLALQAIKNVVENIIRTDQNPQKYETSSLNEIEKPIWEDDERTLESIRKKAWQRTF